MHVTHLLARLEKVRQTGDGRWVACCPAHADKHPSLSIRDAGNGKLLIKCFAECDTANVLGAIGLSFADVEPEKAQEPNGAIRSPFSADQALTCLYSEGLILLVAANDLANNKPFTKNDRARLHKAVGIIGRALDSVRR